MKFGDKYELLDSLTTGSVETFVANDKIRGERVLVHILHCDPQRPNQPTVQWVLDTFRRVAPEPAGLVLEAGRYSGTLYAYLITKLPEDAALQAWVKQYKARARDTQEITARGAMLPSQPVQPIPPAPPAAPTLISSLPPLPSPPQPASSSMTQLLREFEPLAKPAAPSPPPRDVQPTFPPSPSISSPTSDRSGIRPAPPWNAEPPKFSTPKAEPVRTPQADPFPANFLDKNFPVEPSAAPKESPKAGEFTSFFQGPFRGDRPVETPNLSPPSEPPRKNVGDFTAMFGAVKPQPEPPLPTSGMAGNEPAGTGFTGWFNPEIPSRTSSAPFSTVPSTVPVNPPNSIPSTLPGSFPSAPQSPAMPPSGGLPRPSVGSSPIFPEPVPLPAKDPFLAPQPAPYVAPAPPIFPAPTPPSPPMPNLSASVPPEGATRAFSRPGSGEAAPPPPPPPVGPSAYTQIISVRAPRPGEEAGAPEKESAKSITPPTFTAPPLPPLPKLAPPPLPPMPKLAAPKLPPPPKIEVPVPPVSYWPLVLTLTVVVVLAALVILYFVLKH